MKHSKKTKVNVAAMNGQRISDQTTGPWALVCFTFTAFLAFLFMPLFLQRTEPLWDARDWFYPAFNYVADSVAEGRIPLWDPYTNCGLPFHADPQSPTLNPIALFLGYFINDSSLGFVAFWIFHWLWGGIGMIWLTRHFGGKPLGGAFAAITFALSGFFIGHAEHTAFVIVAAWMPWLFWFADKAVLTSNKGWALLGGFSLGMASLGGYPGLFTFSGFAVALWLGLRFLPAWDVDMKTIPTLRERLQRIVSTLVIIAVVSLVIWSPVMNAFFTEGRGYTDRVGALPPEVANYSNAFTMPAVLSLVFPYATIAGRAWMNSDVSLTNGYMGILTIPFAVLWWWNERKRKRHWWIIIFIVFMFLLSFGGQAGLRILLYYIFPPMQYNRHNATYRIFWVLPITLMAGLGFSYFQDHIKNLRMVRIIFSGWLAIVLAVCVVLIYFLSSHGASVGDFIVNLYLPALLILPLFFVLLWTGDSISSFLHKSRMALPLLLILVAADMTIHFYNNSFTVWSTGDSTRQAEALRKRTTPVNGEPGPRLPPFAYKSYNAHQVLKQSVVLAYTPMNNSGFDNILCKSRFVSVLQSPTRFWISQGTEEIHDRDTALSTLSSAGDGDPVPVFVEKGVGVPAKARTVPGSYGKTKVLSYAPEIILMEVDVPAGKEGFLASTERYAPGWKAWIDGIPSKVIVTNLFFRGMVVPSGQHKILWKYEPAKWFPLMWVSFATLLASAVAGIVLVRRMK